MRIFVAGGTGAVGKRLVPLLVEAGAEVTAISRSRAKDEQLRKQGATPVRVDLFDPAALEEAVAGHNTVINVATHVPSGLRALLPRSWREHVRIRSEGSRNLAMAAIAARAGRFIQESFAPAYPDRGDEWIDESVAIAPAKYLVSVKDAEWAADEFTRSGGAGVVLRFALFYGADSAFTMDTVTWVRRGMAPAFGGGDGYISSIWHDDAASAVFAALKVPAGVYNVTDDVPMPRREAFAELARALGVRPPRIPPRWVTRLAGSIGETLGRSCRLSNAKFRNASGWAPSVPSVHEGWKLLAESLSSQARRGARA